MAARISRRRFLQVAGAAAGATAGASLLPDALIEKAAAATAAGSSIRDVKHIVLLMQENRSFDHYFGTMSGVRGFADKTSYRSYVGGPATKPQSIWRQTTVHSGRPLLKVGGESYLSPFELLNNPPTANGQTLNDITHDWGPQHMAWNDGSMDRFVVQHLLNDGTAQLQYTSGPGGLPEPSSSKAPIGIEAMGYYRPGDSLSFYRAVARAFTICDRYHCSVLGPTDPNRLMWLSGSLGAHSRDIGGPVLETYVENREQMVGTLEWPTVPELLTEHGVSWKIYQDPTSNALFNILDYFKSFAEPSTATEAHNAALASAPVYPAEFVSDVKTGKLPAVSWILPPAANCEHPAAPPEYGEYLVAQILDTLVSNPEVWASTVFLVLYDENGGFFDHVAPPTPGPTVTSLADLPAASAPGGALDGEYLRMRQPANAAGSPPSDWDNIRGPVGLGFRVPALVISPFSAGGFACGDVFDHTSTHQLIERAFLRPGELLDHLHVSKWRRQLVGDLTAALPQLASPVKKVPSLPAPTMGDTTVIEQNVLLGFAGTADYGPAYPVPTENGPLPAQEDPGPRRRTTAAVVTVG